MAKKAIKLAAWADVGSHGGIFAFDGGPVGHRYPGLLHIFKEKLTGDLIPVEITYEIESPNVATRMAETE